MTTSAAGQAVDPPAPATQLGSTELTLRLEAPALRDFRAALTADLLQRTRHWLSEIDRPDLAERCRSDLNAGAVLLDPQLGSATDQAPVLNRSTSRGIRPAALRYAGLTARPAVAWCVSWTALDSAGAALDTLQTHLMASPAAAGVGVDPERVVNTLRERFAAALADELDTSTALEVLWQVVRAELPSGERRDLLLELDQVLGLDLASGLGPTRADLPEGAQRLIDERTVARERRDWARADDLRMQLAGMDVEAQDGPAGSVYRRASGTN
jgi:cysteinyl-tRNA synthetase